MKSRYPFDRQSVIVVLIGVLAVIAFIIIFRDGGTGSPANEDRLWTSTAPTKGANHPEVRLTEFGDFECPTCKSFAPIIDHLLSKHPNLAVQYHYFPLTDIHKNALEAAIAAQYAHEQGHFWQMHDLLYANQDAWSSKTDPHAAFAQFLVLLGLDEKPYANNTERDSVMKVVTMDLKTATDLQLTGTPSFFINGKQFLSDLSESNLDKQITEAEK